MREFLRRVADDRLPHALLRRVPHGLLRLVADGDDRLLRRVAATRSPVLDRVLPAAGRAADNSLLWMGVAGALALTGDPRARRAAMRGLVAVAITSATAHTIKAVTGRHRPPDGVAPLARRLRRAPVTTSFPSGHAASAAAFATGVALELPGVGLPLAGAAAAVAVSRVFTGAHHPSDVLAGAAIGVGLGLATQRWWPRRPPVAARAARPRHEAPALPTGAGLVLVVNPAAGGSGEDIAADVRAELPDAQVVLAGPDDDLDELFTGAAHTAVVLGVAGGDGTVNLAARVAWESGLPLFVVPGGTLNHFAADVGVAGVAGAAAALRGGEAVAVDLGVVRTATGDGAARVAAGVGGPRADAVFVNTCSVGVYVDLVRAREKLETRIGKWPAAVVGLVQVLRHGSPTPMVVDGRRRRVWLLFAGNGHYAPPGMVPSHRPRLDDGLLDIRVVDGTRPFTRLRLVLAVATGTLATCRVYQAREARTVRLRSPRGPIGLSLDGEVTRTGTAITIGKSDRALIVYRPAESGTTTGPDGGPGAGPGRLEWRRPGR
ncbi:glycerophosphatase [Longispora fulva]|uniref:Undecaprenyl-diphosphatase n=1 Tax=Longispora fulva TaxID=619741 RepID=A0A8J7GNT7_9ACTN|nr:phosphatase PAP2 family protein [Longispora fulva]MBG6135073.1 undecaprenyl-diphosphatase [Longispora fulva]GIG56692.1 glycerophosphatase [Longispora fulva]